MPAPHKILFHRAARLLPWFLFVGAALALISTPASAAVKLVFFRASTEPQRVFLEWLTATELDNAGFIVRRNQSGGSDPNSYSQIPVIDADTGEEVKVIPARGDGVTGAYYPFFDENVNIGTRYYYLLQDIDIRNNSNYNGPVEVVAGQTPTPSPTSTTSPTNTPTQTPTTPVTNTPSPTGQSAPSTATQSGYPAPTQPGGYPAPSQPAGPSPTLDPNVTPVNATLTAIAQAVTALATESGTTTPAAATQPAGETPTPEQTATPAESAEAESTPEAEQEDASFNRLILLGVIFLASGLLLTGGIIYLARMNQDQT